MKKLLTVFLVFILLASNFAIALADEDEKENSNADDLLRAKKLEIRNVDEIRKAELKNRTAIARLENVEGKLRNRYNACIEKCKAAESENCDVRCRGLMVAADKLNIVENRLQQAELNRLKILSEDEVKKVAALNKSELKKLAHLDGARLKKLVKLDQARLKAELKDLKLIKVKEKNIAKKRALTEEQIKKWNEQFNNAKDNFLKNEALYKESRKAFNEMKEKLKECEGKDTEECKKLNEDAMARGKEFLLHAADVAIEHLNKIKARVEAAENIEEDEAAEMATKIDAAIAELNAIKEKVNAAATKEELQEAAKSINQIWKRIKYNAMTYASRVVHTRVGLIVKKAEKLEDKMHCAASQLEEGGEPVEEINGMIDKFSAKVDTARNAVEKSEELLKQAREIKVSEDPSDERAKQIKSLLDEAKKLINQAHKDLKDAHELLKKIFKLLKDSGVDVTGCREDGELEADEVYAVEGASETTVGEVVSNGAAEEDEPVESEDEPAGAAE